MKILVVEDDVLVAQALKMTLGNLKYTVEVAHDGQAGLDFIEAFDYDLLLLDALLPKLDGISLCRRVRSSGYMMPILLLTSKDSKHDRATGLDAGADDYVIKPFEPEELSARIRALLRRGNDRVQPVLTCEQLTLDPRNYEVTYRDRLLNLTPKEYTLLELFLRYNRRLFSCGAILQHLWTYEDAPSEEAVRTHIKGLRHKLKAAGAPVDFIETVYGSGYRLKGDASTDVTSPRVHPPWHTDTERSQSSLSSLSCGASTESNVQVITPEPTANSQQPTTPDSQQFLTEIWNRHYAQTLARVDAIEQVITAIFDGSLTPAISSEAKNSAHTLAGTLGTFGLTLGSQVAKQIELLLTENLDPTPAQVSQIQHHITRLRQEIISKTPRTSPVKLPTQPPQLPCLLAISTDRDLVSALRSATSNFKVVTTTELTPSQLDRSPSVIILDLDCFSCIADGLSALSELERDYPQLPVLVLSQPDTQLSIPSPDPLIPHRQSLAVISPPPSIDSIWMGTELPASIAARGIQQLQQRIEVARRGVRLFLSKPIPARQILVAIDRVLARVATQARVTIVDDDLLLLEGVKALLSLRGMAVTTLSEPSRFWETLEASAPDLLILDLDMPSYDGIELCRAVRTDPQWATLPILFLTAHTASLAIDRVFAAGADDFVTKPASDSTLVNRIVNRLERIGFLGVRGRE
ncbi:response regulator [Chamaesiphon sp. GL140_3_metabinner_50]|uniref:response regulator n=1 Tax=Chamaesiphon sp. GL140_3_metabinner_50 TaxID=2970812 RepID=UPI0025EF4E32|nr:response regulator [Chamaesiphon sp. GL140_3_metabinner_50]